jgi:peptidoglycan/xylan/chitin deacetylase (PgdA/CDA1 family)
MGRVAAIDRVLLGYRRAARLDEGLFFEQLEDRAQVRVDQWDPGVALFMSWEEVRALRTGGMSVGAHSHAHPILARLPEAEQRRELAESRRILEEALGGPILTMSYPVGGRRDFSATTKRLCREAGYRLAFAYYGGINRPGHTDPFELLRMPVDRYDGLPLLRTRAVMYHLIDRSVL